jgi:vancomycin permeability regulator SanA
MRTAIMLGAAVGPNGLASPTLERRAKHAAALYLDGQVDRILLTGGIGQNPPSEAHVAAQICYSFGINPSNVLLEENAQTTLENFVCALDQHPSIQWDQLIIVTDKYHAVRASMTARALRLNYKTDCPPLKGSNRRKIIKSYLREIPAILFYAVKLRSIIVQR